MTALIAYYNSVRRRSSSSEPVYDTWEYEPPYASLRVSNPRTPARILFQTALAHLYAICLCLYLCDVLPYTRQRGRDRGRRRRCSWQGRLLIVLLYTQLPELLPIQMICMSAALVIAELHQSIDTGAGARWRFPSWLVRYANMISPASPMQRAHHAELARQPLLASVGMVPLIMYACMVGLSTYIERFGIGYHGATNVGMLTIDHHNGWVSAVGLLAGTVTLIYRLMLWYDHRRRGGNTGGGAGRGARPVIELPVIREEEEEEEEDDDNDEQERYGDEDLGHNGHNGGNFTARDSSQHYNRDRHGHHHTSGATSADLHSDEEMKDYYYSPEQLEQHRHHQEPPFTLFFGTVRLSFVWRAVLFEALAAALIHQIPLAATHQPTAFLLFFTGVDGWETVTASGVGIAAAEKEGQWSAVGWLAALVVSGIGVSSLILAGLATLRRSSSSLFSSISSLSTSSSSSSSSRKRPTPATANATSATARMALRLFCVFALAIVAWTVIESDLARFRELALASSGASGGSGASASEPSGPSGTSTLGASTTPPPGSGSGSGSGTERVHAWSYRWKVTDRLDRLYRIII